MTDDIEDLLDRLESLVEQQHETIEAQRATIDQQRERIAALEGEVNADAPDDDGDPALVDRRDALKTGGLLALLFGGVGTASADPQGQVGTSNDPLTALHTDAINGGVTGESELTSLLGDGLALSDGSLVADLQQVGSGTGVLSGVSADGITYRSLSASDGVSLSSGSGTISVGLADTETETTTTFAEPEVTVQRSQTTAVDGGAITLPSFATVARPTDNNTASDNLAHGLQIKAKRELPEGIRVTMSSTTTGASDVYLTDTDGNTLASRSFPGPGMPVTIDYTLSANTRYYVFVFDDDNYYDIGEYINPSYPYNSDSLTIETGAYIENNGTVVDSPGLAFAIADVTPVSSSSGSATVEWDEPASVSRWETAAFQADGAVDVYVQTSSDGGTSWSEWSTNPIAPGTDLSAIPPDDRVRFRVELSRDDESNVPRLTKLTRQWRP